MFFIQIFISFWMLLFLSFQSRANFNIGAEGGLTLPYETTIVGSIGALLNKNGLELDKTADYGNPNRIGLGGNIVAQLPINFVFSVTGTFGVWYYRNLNNFGLFTLHTLPINFGLRYNYKIFSIVGFYALETLTFLNFSRIESDINIGEEKYFVVFKDHFLLLGISPIMGFTINLSEKLLFELSFRTSYIFRQVADDMLYFNIFGGFRYSF